MQKEHDGTLENDFDFKVAMFKRVFGSDEGKLILEYLEKLYSPKFPNFNPNVDYYALGKYRVVQEIRALINSERKVKK